MDRPHCPLTPAKTPAIRHVIFDAEGLLLDPVPGVRASLQATAELLDGGRRTLAPDWTPRRQSLLATLAELLGTEDPARIAEGCAVYHAQLAAHGRQRFVAHPGAAALLRLMSATQACGWHYLSTLGRRESCRLMCDHHFDAAVRSLFSSEAPSCPGLRPHLLSALLTALEADPREVLVLADTPADLLAAEALGLRTVALDYGRCPPTVLAGIPATQRVDSIAALLHWLRPRLALRPPAAGPTDAPAQAMTAVVDPPSLRPRAARLH